MRASKIAQARFQAEVDEASATAQMAGPLADAAARQEVVVQETEVAKLEAARREQQLEAEVRRPADAARYRVEQEALAARAAVIAEGEAQAAAMRAIGEAEAFAIQAKGLAEAEAIERRAQALAGNSQAVVLHEIAENYPAIVANAAKAFENVGNMQVLNGAEGVTEMITSVIGQGLAGLSVVRGMLDVGQPAVTPAVPAQPTKE